MPSKPGFLRALLASTLLLLTLAASAAADSPRILDAFDDPASWSVVVSDGVELKVSAEPGRSGGCARLDYDFTRGSGYAIIRKRFDLELPSNYRFSYGIRGEGPSNTVEFKLIDPTGDNVWWRNTRNFDFPRQWQTVTTPRRKISFAWGPSTSPLRQVQAIELVITSFNGGRGTVWFDDLTFEPLPEPQPYAGTPTLHITGTDGPGVAIPGDGPLPIAVRAAAGQSFVIEFGQVRELGGLMVEWGPHFPRDYDIVGSTDTSSAIIGHVRGSSGGRDLIPLPDATVSKLEIRCTDQQHSAIEVKALRFLPSEFGDSTNNLLGEYAARLPRGNMPRYLSGEATYWTVIGVPGDASEALINEEGAIEVDKLAFSLEPFVYSGGKLLTWADSSNSQSLLDGFLPIPTVHRALPGLDLAITGWAAGDAGRSALLARYVLTNTGEASAAGTLFIALRPMQVNPPYQNLNIMGGAATTERIACVDRVITVDERTVEAFVQPDAFGATTFDGGEVIEYLARGEVPPSVDASDVRGLASAALAYRFDLAPGESSCVGFRVLFHTPGVRSAAGTATDAQSALTTGHQAARAQWHGLLDRVNIRLPAGNERITDSIRANLAYILINRDGPAIQPGSRSYERTWIRDGALTSTALLAMGLDEYVREFLDWFAPYQYDSGKIPCCVDHRGPDPVPEHDSHGQYIYAVRQYFAHTRDAQFVRHHYPRVVQAVRYIEFLRAQRLTDEFRAGPPDKRVLYGLMPESISHEGYSAKPMHSYWDDLWTLKGLADAAVLAEIMDDGANQKAFSSLRDSFAQTLMASMRLAMELRSIDYIPGCAELGDFDATSTTIGLFPCGQTAHLPQPQLDNTFERYWQFFTSRRDGTREWKDYTPYEHRAVGAMVLLGRRDRAHEILDYFFTHQRPAGWRHWAEVVRADPRERWFIGDMPHTWVGADFINSVVLMFAYSRAVDDALILGAGLPRAWLESPDGLEIQRLRTEHGPLSYRSSFKHGRIRIEIDALESTPPGGVWFAFPDSELLGEVTVNGSRITPSAGEVRLPVLPAVIETQFQAPTRP